MKTRDPHDRLRASAAALATLFALGTRADTARAHSVAQVQTAKQIAPVTVAALDPQGNPMPGDMGTDTTAKVGDVLTFIIRFTAAPNSASRGAGGYITEYVPANTEVVGARIIDKDGNTLRPGRGPEMDDGWGPRGRKNQYDAMGLLQGSLSQLYADTGIFFSTDPRTIRTPSDASITVLNGLTVNPVPSGAGQLDNFLGFTGPPFYAHDEWDRIQAIAYGANGGLAGGTGVPPFEFGSPVAGPETHYAFEQVLLPACSDGMDNDADGGSDYPNDVGCASALDDDETPDSDAPVGPWRRVRYEGSEIGTGADTDCQSCQGAYVRTGVPTNLGWDLSLDNPLPPATNAVRFAVGELVAGEEYFAEISLRVKALPLEPMMNRDINCSEVFGGDAAMPQTGQDNAWRYFVPAPACVSLNLQFDLDVDRTLAVQGDKLVYTIRGKNLSVDSQDDVVVTDTFVAADLAFGQVLQGPAPMVGNGLLTWPMMMLLPGDEFLFQWDMTITGNNLSTLNRARYTSIALPAPGFSVTALTSVYPLVIIQQSATVATDPITDPPTTTAGSNVRYTAVATNIGTGPATLNAASFVRLRLPAGFSYCAPPTCPAPTINGVNVANPTIMGDVLIFKNGLATVPAKGGMLTVAASATVGGAVTPGLYTIGLASQFRDAGIGRDVETETLGLAPLLVDIDQSVPPVLDEPVFAGATKVTGATSEGAGALVTVYVNGNSVPAVVAGAGGVFSAMVPTLYPGQHLNATAQAGGEVTSFHSAPDVIVQGGPAACNDGLDNDGDGFADFPDDPGCDDAGDNDETNTPQCSDGVDNDGDGFTDFPDDLGCADADDDDETDEPDTSSGTTTDGTGTTTSGTTTTSSTSGTTTSSTTSTTTTTTTGSPTTGGGSVGGDTASGGGPTDSGDSDATGGDASEPGGCGCRSEGSRGDPGAAAALLVLAALGAARPRRHRREP